MQNTRRETPGGRGGSRDARTNSSSTDLPVSRFEVARLIKAARTDVFSLYRVAMFVHSLSDKMQTEYFDVLYHHLQKPVEDHSCKDEESFLWTLWSLRGVTELGCPYFERDAAHKHRFTECWPNIVKWLKAILDVGHFYGEENQYFALAGDAFDIGVFVHEGAPLDNDGVMELGVRVWIGTKASDGSDQYSSRSLLACLMVSEKMRGNGPCRIDQALHACNMDGHHLINKILARLKHATFRSSPKKVRRVVTLTTMMAHLVGPRETSSTMAILKVSAGRTLVSITKAIINDTGSSADYMLAVRSSLTVIFGSLLFQTIEYATSITKAGILGLLPQLASLDSKDELKPSPSDILQKLLLCLAYDEFVFTCRVDFQVLYSGDMQFKDFLKTSSKRFRDTWKAFETVLLEHTVLSKLFKVGYAPERGVCANLTCRRVADRAQFRKCAGCAFVLYCSTSCQREDWNSHRNRCKKVQDDKHCLDVIQDKFNRFPRRVAMVHINRQWNQIVTLAQGKNIPLSDIAVEIACTDFPLGIHVFDYHELLEGAGKVSHLAMVANEILLRPVTDRYGSLMVVLCMPRKKNPCIVHLNDVWTKSVSELLVGPNDERATYTDQDGITFPCENIDALRASVLLARKYAADLGQPVWNEDILNKATDDVIGEFGEELGLSECLSSSSDSMFDSESDELEDQ